MKIQSAALPLALSCAAAATAFGGTARVQVIHNAADPAAEVVDVWAGPDRLINDFAFRTATPFIDVPAGVEIEIGVAPGESQSAGESLATFAVTFEASETYHVVATGVLDADAFAANPDGASTAFTLIVDDGARERARLPWIVDLRAIHGVTDAPTVDIVVEGRPFGPLVDDVSYGGITRYRGTFARELELDVTTGDGSTVVASFLADVRGLRGGAAAVFASGFLTSEDDQNGPAFGLFVALPDGTVLPLGSEALTARLQVVHNAADPAAEKVDVYLDGDRIIDDFAFRTASPFIDVPAGREIVIAVAPPTSASAGEALADFSVELAPHGTYVAIANGVLDTGEFSENPDGRSVGFTLFSRDEARERAWWGRRVVVAAFHGATDAPAVDVTFRRQWYEREIEALAYGDFQGYVSVPPLRYRVDVSPAGTDAPLVSYDANLRSLAGRAAVVFASGFLTPENNQDGPAFGLFAALPDGRVVALPAWDSSRELPGEEEPVLADLDDGRFRLAQNAPNPFNPITRISFEIPARSDVLLSIYNVGGERVREVVNQTMDAGFHTVTLDAAGLASGVYYYKIEAGSFRATRRMTLLK